MFICECWLFDWYFPQFCKFDMSKCGYLVSEGPFNFEIMRVDCISFFFSFLDSLCILCLKEIIWAMATFLPLFWPWENYLGHGNFFVGHGQKSGHGRKNVAHGKNGKMFFNVYF